MKLLTASNPKIEKGVKFGYQPFILHLAPHTLSGFNVCPGSSEDCRSTCLFFAGRGKFPMVQEARIRKTKMYFEQRDTFLDILITDIRKGIRFAEKRDLIPCFRLNGLSDIRWERHGIFKMFPDNIFYDYTKLSNRNVSDNYHLTFSASGENETDVQEAFANGMNVAVVFHDVPSEYNGIPVINGDEHDLRFLDPKGVYVGLKAKGLARTFTGEFVK